MAIISYYTAAVLVSLISCSASLVFPNAPAMLKSIPQRTSLPEKIIVGYANWNQCDDKIVQAVQNGVNVVIWFSINLSVSSTGEPIVTSGPDMDCVASKIKTIREMNLPTVHLISIGGWNSPHPDTSNSPKDVYESWNHWNRHIAARPEQGFFGFDGFDWDIEGNDVPSSQYNHFTCECLDLMGQMSQMAKQHGKYIVSMAPAESYLDPTQAAFDRSLLHEYEEWETLAPNFAYHGMNAYAYLLSKYGSRNPHLDGAETVATPAKTFDFVTIQLYEGYSHAEYNTSVLKEKPSDYLKRCVRAFAAGWSVDFRTDEELNYPYAPVITVPNTELVVGLANGWAGDGKFLLIYPEELEEAYTGLQSEGLAPKGFGFWDILDEGKESPQRPNEPLWLASGLNSFMKIRD